MCAMKIMVFIWIAFQADTQISSHRLKLLFPNKHADSSRLLLFWLGKVWMVLAGTLQWLWWNSCFQKQQSSKIVRRSTECRFEHFLEFLFVFKMPYSIYRTSSAQNKTQTDCDPAINPRAEHESQLFQGVVCVRLHALQMCWHRCETSLQTILKAWSLKLKITDHLSNAPKPSLLDSLCRLTTVHMRMLHNNKIRSGQTLPSSH